MNLVFIGDRSESQLNRVVITCLVGGLGDLDSRMNHAKGFDELLVAEDVIDFSFA